LNKAETAYLKAYELEPENSNYLSALISFYLDSGNKTKTRFYLLKWISLHPDDKAAQGLYDNLK
jgi:cytochrome c-type biogenesis protein CcmH/NrfG